MSEQGINNSFNNSNNIVIQGNVIQDIPFSDKINSTDLLNLISDFVPSLFFLFLISLTCSLVNQHQMYNATISDFILILRTYMIVYSWFIIKGLINVLLIHFNKAIVSLYNISMYTLHWSLTVVYYIATILGYSVFMKRDGDCFITNTYLTAWLFILLLFGGIGIFQEIFNILIVMICFPALWYSFTIDPVSFYTNYGTDPEVIYNLPTIKANSTHWGSCVVCTDEIKENQEIIVLKCQGKHIFHEQCIKSWWVVKVCCPTCRSNNVF